MARARSGTLIKSPRIGVAGSAGVGKTTLALTLGATLGIPVLPEVMRGRLEAGFSLHAITRREHQALLRGDAADQAALVQGTVNGCVTDRTPFDFLAFWFCNGYAAEAPAETEEFVADCVAAASLFDLIVLMPWGALPLVADGVRSTNPWHQLHGQTMIEGLCVRYMPKARLAFLPSSLTEPDSRCDWVLRQLGPVAA